MTSYNPSDGFSFGSSSDFGLSYRLINSPSSANNHHHHHQHDNAEDNSDDTLQFSFDEEIQQQERRRHFTDSSSSFYYNNSPGSEDNFDSEHDAAPSNHHQWDGPATYNNPPSVAPIAMPPPSTYHDPRLRHLSFHEREQLIRWQQSQQDDDDDDDLSNLKFMPPHQYLQQKEAARPESDYYGTNFEDYEYRFLNSDS
ncbi:hypothetical protein EV182_000244 [Spiromyces aspiralis]|uniref:Uncharacterized protein n=1 Tax=Spiromyces aspiralis TaxID=68401 RepID=A0ACC1HHW0_9FUNG|nr:hypothetical protein EV182_000244 [Spiromyces aspiralis]